MDNDESNTKKKQDNPWQFRPHAIVAEWWKEFNSNNRWKKNQALNLALAKFMNRGDKEIESLCDIMRELDERAKAEMKAKPTEVKWEGSDK